MAKSLPLEFVNRLDLADKEKAISRFKLLVLPLTSGLQPEEVNGLASYVRGGGTLLVAGDALRHDEKGEETPDFAMAEEMGVRFAGSSNAKEEVTVEGLGQQAGWPASPRLRQLVRVRPATGQTLVSFRDQGALWPLVHVHPLGAGRIVYLASLDSVELTQSVIDSFAGPGPVAVSPAEKNPVVATYQSATKRWILHLIGDGNYTVHVNRDCIPAAKVVDRYPKSGWNCRERATATGLQLEIHGDMQDRLVVLE